MQSLLRDIQKVINRPGRSTFGQKRWGCRVQPPFVGNYRNGSPLENDKRKIKNSRTENVIKFPSVCIKANASNNHEMPVDLEQWRRRGGRRLTEDFSSKSIGNFCESVRHFSGWNDNKLSIKHFAVIRSLWTASVSDTFLNNLRVPRH